jgi:hypothetical protein
MVLKEVKQSGAEDHVSSTLQVLVGGISNLHVSVACVSFYSGTGLNI